jgi:hypothetical protein
MNQVVLLFPDTIALTEFLLKHRISGAEVNTRERSLTCKITDSLVLEACTKYQAQIQIKAGLVPHSFNGN